MSEKNPRAPAIGLCVLVWFNSRFIGPDEMCDFIAYRAELQHVKGLGFSLSQIICVFQSNLSLDKLYG